MPRPGSHQAERAPQGADPPNLLWVMPASLEVRIAAALRRGRSGPNAAQIGKRKQRDVFVASCRSDCGVGGHDRGTAELGSSQQEAVRERERAASAVVVLRTQLACQPRVLFAGLDDDQTA